METTNQPIVDGQHTGKTAVIADRLYAKESQHWYYRSGKICDRVLSADKKKMIAPDIRHARRLGLLPGVTQVIGCADKPVLTMWRIEQAILSSLTLTRRAHEPDREFLKRVFEDSGEQAKKAADMGTAIHGAIECHVGGRSFDPKLKNHVDGAMEVIASTFGARQWIAEFSFANPLGYGSKIDLHSEGAPVIVLDSKGKEFDERPTATNRIKLWYDEHAMQLAAYRHELGRRTGLPLSSIVCGNLFFSRNVPGLSYIHIWENEDIDRGWEQFKALHRYWCVTRRYDPAFDDMREIAA